MQNTDDVIIDAETKQLMKKMRNRDDFSLDTPMKRMLAVTNMKRLAREIDIPYSSIYRYVSGLNKDIQYSDYEKIKKKLQELVNAL